MGLGAWEGGKPKELLLVAIPHTGFVTSDWAIHFKILQPPCAFSVISNRGLPIDRAREDLVHQAVTMGATHLFFLDSDVVMPPDGLMRLFSHRLPIVAGIYGSKQECCGVWVEQAKSGDARYAAVAPQTFANNQLFTHPGIVTGAGCLLIDMAVFKKLKEPWFLWTQGRDKGGCSEDFYFLEKCREVGIPIHVDPVVKCRHIDSCALDWTGKRERLQT
jgi:hypothetical protein